MSLLKVKNITLKFGGLVAVDNVSFDLHSGEVLSIIGPNGAGKTSLFNLVSGLYKASSGAIFFKGKKLEQRADKTDICKWILLSLILASAFVVLINSQQLWQSAISSQYIYQQEFSYWQSSKAAYATILDLDWSWSLFPFVAVFFICIAASVNFEIGARTGPLVSARAGIARTFQNLRLIPGSTVLENVKVACRRSKAPKLLCALLSLPKSRQYELNIEAAALESLKILELDHFANELATALPYGTLRRVEIARALASNPKILMLDEPAAGLNPSESQDLLVLIKKIAKSGITVLLIEHDMSVVMNVSDRIVVLHHGKKIAEGTPQEVKTNPEVTKAYLGTNE